MVAIVTQTDFLSRSQSLCNRSLGGVFVVKLLFGFFFVGVGAFVIGLSQIFSLFSYLNEVKWLYKVWKIERLDDCSMLES